MQIDPKFLEVPEDFSILIVEDSKVSREYLKNILQYHYKNIYLAENGLEGIQKFKEWDPLIVISDISMPEMDGLTMIRELKKIKNHFYAIILSAHDEKEFLKDAISIGVYRFISKPIQIPELLSTIENIKEIHIYQEKINRQAELIEIILNALDIILIITDGKELHALNHYGLQFIGFSSLSEFKQKHKCICEFFIEKEGFIKNSKDWLQIAESLSHEQRKVIIQKNSTKENHIFSINIHNLSLHPNLKIIFFYDITVLEKQKEELKELATMDFLTKIYNRHHFHTILEFHMEKHLRYKELNPFSLVMLDLDHFKKINDTYGHLIGDEVLKEFASLVKQNIRKADFFARWGGEEFLILSTENTKEQLIEFAEKIRNLVKLHFEKHPKLPPMTVSIGVTQFRSTDNLNLILERVDQALYLAKEKGRNRVEFL
ncbi:MAG: diguanylate cyclase [Leptonema sp. (in: bacteria)]